jgi:propionyl-CoA carboxylase alpha chain
VRVDTGIETGSVISPYFDPMLAKVIAHGPTRREAAYRLERALRRTRVRGVRTNRELLISILGHDAFLAGDTTTDFIARHQPASALVPTDAQLRAAALTAALADRARHQASLPADRPIPRSLPAGYRNNRSQGQITRYAVDDRELETSYWAGRDGSVTAVVDGHPVRAAVRSWSAPVLSVELNEVLDAHSVVSDGNRVWVGGPGFEVEFRMVPRFPNRTEQAVEGGLTAPMNGTVAALEVREGERVRTGQAIVVIEAMKMEHRVAAPYDGVLEKVLTQPGAVVATGQLLAIVTPAAGAGQGNDDPRETEAGS